MLGIGPRMGFGAIGRRGAGKSTFSLTLSQVAHHWSIQLLDLIKPNFKPISNQNQIQILPSITKNHFTRNQKKKSAYFLVFKIFEKS